ncbi:phytanoyl-CoA dioxygenase family protein [Spongiibacter pelagi]|uniref:phytanoyl-CoA dioxygenase family protein n=1 Tax=Spongiibacter pelagi TaxID=2760804 RepID=UPI00295A8255|nr:phytanoyl-CoA dioxygenase family protein [Spongiibacter pelagi]
MLQARFQEWGYLHFKGVVSANDCNAVKQGFLAALSPYITANAVGMPELNGEPFFETDPIWDAVYPKMQSLEAFQALFHRPELQDLMAKVRGAEVFVYPMKMARIATPRKLGYETPPHQDAYSHHAGPTMAGLWVALHDVDESMGRLKLLPKSHKHGVRNVFQAQGVGGVQCEIFPEENTWHVSNVEQGDVIIFHACTVHKAEPNTADKAVRLSVDTRFCDYGAPVFISNIEPHHGWRIEALSWESIYAGWADTSLQYYWRDYPGLFSEMRDQSEWHREN